VSSFSERIVNEQNVERWRVNHQLAVLRADEQNHLNIVGKIDGFGIDETVRSARFLGNKGFVVTFRQVDPLFTFDLSDPVLPQLKGELTIPGFSTYMHPLDGDRLLTIGRDVSTNGIDRGLLLQLFDVSDLSAPALLHKHAPTIGGKPVYWSDAVYNHLAFNYYAPAKVLSVPVNTYFETAAGQFIPFNVMISFQVDAETGFTQLGEVGHGDLLREILCTPVNTGVSRCDLATHAPDVQMLRSIVMTDSEDNTYLYSVSNIGVKAVSLSDLNTAVGKAVFASPEPMPLNTWASSDVRAVWLGQDFVTLTP
jgi:hypothetical protein